jgi:hypothetical protein
MNEQKEGRRYSTMTEAELAAWDREIEADFQIKGQRRGPTERGSKSTSAGISARQWSSGSLCGRIC